MGQIEEGLETVHPTVFQSLSLLFVNLNIMLAIHICLPRRGDYLFCHLQVTTLLTLSSIVSNWKN